MSERSHVKDGAEGRERPAAPSFLGLKSRVRTLYRARRRSVLEVSIAELERRYGPVGLPVHVDHIDHRYARVELEDGTKVEVGFKGNFRLFGALIDTQWVARRGEVDDALVRYDYRFDKKTFVPARRDRNKRVGVSAAETVERGRALADDTVIELAGRSELKSMAVLDGPNGRQIELVPLAGTITAVYFPPLPPYTVALKAGEVRDHLSLLEHLIRSAESA